MFRFTIRDVLWLTAMAAVLVAWWVDRSGLVAKVAAEKDRAAGFQQAFGDLAEVEYARTHGLPLPPWAEPKLPATPNRP